MIETEIIELMEKAFEIGLKIIKEKGSHPGHENHNVAGAILAVKIYNELEYIRAAEAMYHQEEEISSTKTKLDLLIKS